jgi:hypothetical protein
MHFKHIVKLWIKLNLLRIGVSAGVLTPRKQIYWQTELIPMLTEDSVPWSVISLYIIKAYIYFQRRVYLPLCSGIFPLGGSVLVVNKVNSTIRLNTFLPACWQSTQWVLLLLLWYRHCRRRVLQIQQSLIAWIMIMRKLYQSQTHTEQDGCTLCFWLVFRRCPVWLLVGTLINNSAVFFSINRQMPRS